MLPSIEIIAASISKKGHRPDENEDARAVRRADDAVFAAVADGATESVYAGLWADALARCLIEPSPWRTWLDTDALPSDTPTLDTPTSDTPTSDTPTSDARPSDTSPLDAFREAIDRARTVWSESVDEATAAASTDVPWYVTEKREQGAFATVLGIALLPPASDPALKDGARTGRILAASIGDCGLFRIDAGGPMGASPSIDWAWPHDDPEAFTHRPELVSSRGLGSGAEIQFQAGEWKPGDVFALATDAVAAWLLREPSSLPASDDEAEAWLREAQSDGRLRNDDSTVVILRPHVP